MKNFIANRKDGVKYTKAFPTFTDGLAGGTLIVDVWGTEMTRAQAYAYMYLGVYEEKDTIADVGTFEYPYKPDTEPGRPEMKEYALILEALKGDYDKVIMPWQEIE